MVKIQHKRRNNTHKKYKTLEKTKNTQNRKQKWERYSTKGETIHTKNTKHYKKTPNTQNRKQK